jgi:RNA polymerase sigma factor (sigma-70 family)
MSRLLSLVERLDERGLRESRFRACYEADYHALRRYVARLAGDPIEADDLTQEAFVRLWRRLQQEDVAELRPFLYRIATNLVLNRRRDRTRASTVEAQVPEVVVQMRPAPGDLEQDLVRRHLIQQTLARLPEPMRQCVLLYHHGLTAKEIAAVVGVSPGYVSTLVMRGHQRFRRERSRLEEDQ